MYAKLPEGDDFQLIDGDIVMTPSPGSVHQQTSARLGFLFQQFLHSTGLGTLFYAPMDVYFTEYDTFQPDILIISRNRLEIIKEKRTEGAPDLIVEILSPSSGHYDLTQKKKVYESFGVKEYWIVDPIERTVEVCENGEMGFTLISQAKHSGRVDSNLMRGVFVETEKLFEGL